MVRSGCDEETPAERRIPFRFLVAFGAVLAAACAHSPPPPSAADVNLYAKYGPVPTGEVAVADIDGDGASDLFVGLPEYPGRRGRVAVWLGGADPIGPRPTSFLVEPGVPTGSFGRAIANAGDVDGDGLDDVVVSAPSPGPCEGYFAREFAGRVFLFRGARGRVPGTPHAVLRGDARVGAFGGGFDGSGDVDGDGYSDVIVRADGHRGDPCAPGIPAVLPEPVPPEAYLLRGSRAGLSRDLVITPWRRVLGDHDRDGRADVLPIGDVGILGEHHPRVFVPSETMPGYGSALGDVNGDGFLDLVMGRSGQWRGRVFVYAGGKAGLHEPPAVRFIGPLMHRPGVEETPENVDSRSQTAFGASVAATDVDHDGFADVIVGAPWDDKFYVYPGRSSFPAAAPRRVIGALRPHAWFPTAMVTGDFNRDGFGDVVVTDMGERTGDARRSNPWLFLYMGSAKGLGTTPDAVVHLGEIE